MRSIHPARPFVIAGASVLTLICFAPRPANASCSGDSCAPFILGAVILLEAADIGVGVYDLLAVPRISKRTAALQLLLTVPQVVFGSVLIVAWSGPEGNALGGLIGFGLTAIPLAVAVYSIYVLLSPEPEARLGARLERGIGIELPTPRVAGIERVMLTPTVISTGPVALGRAPAFHTDNSRGSRQLAPGLALSIRFF